MFVAGAAVQWLRDGLRVIERSADVERLAAGVTDTGGVYLVPAFVGLGAPYWDPYARGVIVGLTRGTGLAEIARATIDSMAYQVADLVGAMAADAGDRARRPPGRRRSGGQRRPPPVPGGPARRPGRAPDGRRDDGLGRRRAGRAGGRLLGVAGRDRGDPAGRPAVRAGDGAGPADRAPAAAGTGPSSARATGPGPTDPGVDAGRSERLPGVLRRPRRTSLGAPARHTAYLPLYRA